jgi:hypothetical protein
MKMSDLDENQVASVNQLLQLCREKITIPSVIITLCSLSSIQFLPDLDNKMRRINCCGIVESDIVIPILMQFLASPRADGQQRVMQIEFRLGPVVQKLLNAIKEV